MEDPRVTADPVATRVGEVHLGPFADRFVIEQVLGRGGYGTVYRALDRVQRRPVALKVPHTFDARALLALKDEFRTLAGISHPNLVSFHELFVGPEQWFFTMDLVRGLDCVRWVERAGPRAIPAILRGLAAGLEALHASRVVHRDVKPSNAWVDARGVPVLLDFGLARDLTRGAADETLAGTPLYVAPELVRGGPPSPSSDLYALGIVLHEMIVGRPPFEGAAVAIQGMKLLGGPVRVANVREGVAPELVPLVEALLAVDPSARPTATELVRALDRDASPWRARPSGRPFLGRERELGALDGALDAARAGVTQLVFIEGPAGIGKSSLVEHFLGRRAGPRLVVLRGRCSEHEAVPFKLLDGLLDSLARLLLEDTALRDGLTAPRAIALLAEVFPVFREVLPELDTAVAQSSGALDPQERRRRIARALASLLSDVARARTLVLVVDDVHWADEDGCRLLEEALVSATVGFLLLALHRSDVSSEPLTRLARLGRLAAPSIGGGGGIEGTRSRAPLVAHRVVVPPLAPVDAARLLRDAGRPVDAGLVDAAAGSPFLLETLAASEPAELGPAGAASPAALLRRAVAARIAALPGPARALLETTCVAGHPVAQDVVAEALGVDLDVPSLRTLGASRLVRTAPATAGGAPEIEPYHDLLREVVVELLGPARTQSLHAALARVFAGRPSSDPMWTCLHLQGAGELARAASYAEEGARRAAEALAFARAADLYRFALAHRTADDARSVELQVSLAEALANAGRGRDAADAFLSAARSAPRGPTSHELTRRAAEQYLRAGFFAEGVRHLDAVLEAVGLEVRHTPASAIRSLLANRLWLRRHGLEPTPASVPDPDEERRIDALTSGAVGLSVVDSIRSADLMSEALRRSLASGDATRLASSLAWWTAFLANEGGPAERSTRAVLRAARAQAATHGGAYAHGCCEAAAGLTEFHLGHFGVARTHFERGMEIFEQETRATTKEASTLHIFHHATLAIDGRLDELSRRTEERIRVSEARGERYALVNYRQGLMILRWLAADQPDRAEEDLRSAMDGFEVSGFVVQHWFDAWGRIALALHRGRAREAREIWTRTRTRLVASLLGRTQFTRVQSLALEVLTATAVLAAGEASWTERTRLRGWARLAIRRLRAEDRPWTAALALVLEACLRGAEGDAERGRALLERAVPRLEETELGLYAALARHRLGAADPRHRARADAWIASEHVVDPDRLACAILPGLEALSSSPRAL